MKTISLATNNAFVKVSIDIVIPQKSNIISKIILILNYGEKSLVIV